jgi:hypothetical protein
MSQVTDDAVQAQADLDVAEYQRRLREIEAEQEYREICELQGWDAFRQIDRLEGFLQENQLFCEFTAYARHCAVDENQDRASLYRRQADELETRFTSPKQVH